MEKELVQFFAPTDGTNEGNVEKLCFDWIIGSSVLNRKHTSVWLLMCGQAGDVFLHAGALPVNQYAGQLKSPPPPSPSRPHPSARSVCLSVSPSLPPSLSPPPSPSIPPSLSLSLSLSWSLSLSRSCLKMPVLRYSTLCERFF